MYHSFLIHSSGWTSGGHLGSLHVLAIINSAAMNVGVHVSETAKETLMKLRRLLLGRKVMTNLTAY